ncbi:MAG TPA: hypothetical protein VK563_23545, partial [Puia sp.]|nr:hypothetical protein [Puia sp.]
MNHSLLSIIRFSAVGLFATCLSAILLFAGSLAAQNLQLHEDLRHTVASGDNPHNYPTLYFEYFKSQDTGPDTTRSGFFIQPGSFLLKMQTDFSGAENNPSKFFMQVTQTLRCWKPK